MRNLMRWAACNPFYGFNMPFFHLAMKFGIIAIPVASNNFSFAIFCTPGTAKWNGSMHMKNKYPLNEHTIFTKAPYESGISCAWLLCSIVILLHVLCLNRSTANFKWSQIGVIAIKTIERCLLCKLHQCIDMQIVDAAGLLHTMQSLRQFLYFLLLFLCATARERKCECDTHTFDQFRV